MDAALIRLAEKFPPPSKPFDGSVAWPRLEAALGLTYPSYFKEFVDLYGGSPWFDNLSLFYVNANTDSEIQNFKLEIRKALDRRKDLSVRDEHGHFRDVHLPLYPEVGGIFPFMIDYGDSLYSWMMEGGDPDRWPIVRINTGLVRFFENTTLAKMILDWLDGDPGLERVWGRPEDVDPNSFGYYKGPEEESGRS